MPFFEYEYLPRPTQMDRSGADTTATPTTAAPTTRRIVRALVQTTPLVPQGRRQQPKSGGLINIHES